VHKGRLEAFSDGVIAIIVTIMVLELKTPHDATSHGLKEVAPHFLSYILSFVVVAIMWVNHHHVMQKVETVGNRLLWSNNALLFAMSLIPFATAYMGEHYQDSLPVALFGVVMVLCGVSFTIFRFAAAARYPKGKALTMFHLKDIVSSIAYILSIPLAYVSVYASFFIYVAVAVIYFLPSGKSEDQS
jgi:uncharacterized membrane protein